MLLKHFFMEKIAHSSYILAGEETCAVVDPRRDVDIYINEARELGVTITHILETHLHADFISGHMELAEKTGAKIYAPESGNCRFHHMPVVEGDVMNIDDMRLDVLETPGHTPEHVAYVVTDKSRGDSPIGIFVGDVLFVGDVGRPDLFPGLAHDLAGKLFNSLHDKLLKLPDYCEVYPAHGAGSLCGRSIGAKWTTTIGYERLYNSNLQIKDRDEFIRLLTTDMPPAPDHFKRCSDINRNGPVLISELPFLEELTPPVFFSRLQDQSKVILDIRSSAAYAESHIPGAWHIDLGENFPTFVGWVIPPNQDIMLIADSYQDATTAALWAHRVGLDQVVAYLEGGMANWINSGYPVDNIQLISPEYLYQQIIVGSESFILIDVRTSIEFNEMHIKGAINIPAPDLRSRYNELDRNKPTYVICSSGNRSSLASSILKQHGFRKIYSVSGGIDAWLSAGFPVVK